MTRTKQTKAQTPEAETTGDELVLDSKKIRNITTKERRKQDDRPRPLQKRFSYKVL